MSSERSFFQRMEEFGFLGHIYDHLPKEFTAVFEIARILETEDGTLRSKLEPALRLPTLEHTKTRQEIEMFAPEVITGEEYEADFIRNRRDVARIYSWQFALPDSIFDQRLAERMLWMPVSKTPKILPVQEIGESFSFDSRKQKVFVLFDTSSSMRHHHRIHLAQAILMHFLDRNKADMGFISLRTFDDHVGEMHSAVDVESYNSLIRHILRITDLGNGTVLQKALLTALEEIEHVEHLSGAEILVITDGAVAIDEELIRSKLDENIKIHTIKIGHANIFASEKMIDDIILSGKYGNTKLLQDLFYQEHELSRGLEHSQAHDKHHQYEQSLRYVRSQLREKKAEFAKEFSKQYGHELQRLSSVYVEIDDFDDLHMFRASSEEVDDLEMLIASLEADAEEFFTPEMTKKIAIMHDHINFLLKYEKDPELTKRLEALDDRLQKLLESAMNVAEDGHQDSSNAESMPHSTISLPMTDEDVRDLHFLLEFDSRIGKTQWRLLFLYLKKFVMKGIKKIIRR
ncbi:MAG: VWA domain-containing protein [Bacteroidota bacterium]|nr:VWA domain-containing protein [Bacteroidota bacterium]MDP4230789.1 VWA domain-containing protein [Bacteroidota bacterium]MDP4235914.1 VWA domain-containing protein [Bacteroidota bacterium]